MKKKSRKQHALRRMLGSLGCLGLLAVLGFGSYLGYQALKPLLTPQQPNGPYDTATEDVVVERGDVTDMLQIYGTIQTDKQAWARFTTAQGKVVNVNVFPQQPVQEGQVLVELDREALERTLAQAKADLQEAEAERDELIDPTDSTERLKLQAELLRANETLTKAKQALSTFDAGKDTPLAKRREAAEELAEAKREVQIVREDKERKEQIEFLQWQYNIAEVEHGPYVLIQNPSEKDLDIEHLLRIDMLNRQDDLDAGKLQYQMDLRAAEERIRVAERTLQDLDRELEAGAQEVERLKLVTAVEVAETDVARIQAKLASLGEERPNVALAKAEADVMKKQWLVQDAEAALADAQLVAPFDGIVEDVRVAPGDMVAPGQQLVSILDPTDTYVEARVTDVDVAHLAPGQEIEIRFDAFQGQPPLPGIVGEIPLYGTYQEGITYFQVPVTFTAGEMRPMIGMSVNLAIPKASKEHVLLIPAMAVYRGPEGPFVHKVLGEEITQQRVVLGVSDGIHTEVVEGLQEGDVIRVPMHGPIGPYGPMFRG